MAARSVTMEDVAARAGVSRALVSIVFRNAPGAAPATRERVLAAAAELGYQPDLRASRLGRSRTRTRMLGVVFDVGHAFHADGVDSVYAAATDAGYEVVLSGVTRRRTEATAVSTLLAEKVEAILLLGSALPAGRLAELAQRVPVVSLLRPVRAKGVDVVRTDDAAGVRAAVEHLTGIGHSRVAFADGGRHAGAAERRRGYLTAMRRAQATGWVVPGGLTEADGAATAESVLRLRGRPATAVVAFNDRCALGLVDVVRSRGRRVPADLSVVGFDDISQAGYPHVRLTTVRQDVEGLGRTAVDRLRARLEDGHDDTVHVALPATLVVRGTTAPPGRYG